MEFIISEFPHVLRPIEKGCRVEVRSNMGTSITKQTSAYKDQDYFDTVVFDQHEIMHLASRYGAHRILVGTGYLRDTSRKDSAGIVDKFYDLSSQEKAAINGGNPRRPFNIGNSVAAAAERCTRTSLDGDRWI